MPDATTDNEKKDENFVKFKSTLINFVRAKYSDEVLANKESFIGTSHFSSSFYYIYVYTSLPKITIL